MQQHDTHQTSSSFTTQIWLIWSTRATCSYDDDMTSYEIILSSSRMFPDMNRSKLNCKYNMIFENMNIIQWSPHETIKLIKIVCLLKWWNMRENLEFLNNLYVWKIPRGKFVSFFEFWFNFLLLSFKKKAKLRQSITKNFRITSD